jgi:hypothetical protein
MLHGEILHELPGTCDRRPAGFARGASATLPWCPCEVKLIDAMRSCKFMCRNGA